DVGGGGAGEPVAQAAVAGSGSTSTPTEPAPAETDWSADIASNWRGAGDDDEDGDRNFGTAETPTLRDHLRSQLWLTNLSERHRRQGGDAAPGAAPDPAAQPASGRRVRAHRGALCGSRRGGAQEQERVAREPQPRRHAAPAHQPTVRGDRRRRARRLGRERL